MKQAVVARLLKSLITGHHILKYQGSLSNHRHGCDKPAVAQVALVQVEAGYFANDKLWIGAYLMWSLPDHASRWLLSVVERTLIGREFRVTEEVLRVVLLSQLFVDLIFVRIRLILVKMRWNYFFTFSTSQSEFICLQKWHPKSEYKIKI